MTRRHDLERHRHSLAEIRNIMNSMKTLAYMETRKLARFLDAQHAVTGSIRDVAADFLNFHAGILPETRETRPVYLLIGTERGFCGDFNHALLRQLEAIKRPFPPGWPLLIAVGHKLHVLLEGDMRVAAFIDGASIAEEVTSLLNQVVSNLTALQNEHGLVTVDCLSHNSDNDIVTTRLLPPFQDITQKSPRFPHAPDLNLSPRKFLIELTEHYLFAALHELFYTSLMAENHQRMTHLEGAVKHLDDDAAKLARQCNALRQEEIIEEIEVILLSAGNPTEQPDRN